MANRSPSKPPQPACWCALGVIWISLAASTAGAVPPRAPPSVRPLEPGEQPLELAAHALQEGAESMSADEAAVLSRKTAPSLARAQAATRRAEEAATQALIAVYPRLDLAGRYSRLEGVDDLSFGGTTIEVVRDRWLLEARVTVPVSELFLQILPRYSAAIEAAEAERLTARAEEQSIELLAREAFYNYARARASLLISRSSVAQREAQRRDVEVLVSEGSMARVELLRAESQVASASGALARAEGAVAIARTALRSLLHRDGDQDFAIAEELTQPLPHLTMTNNRLLERAIQNRSELRALRTLLRAQERTIRASGGGKLPKFAIEAAYAYAKPDPNTNGLDDTPPWTDNWFFFGSLTWSPNDYATASSQSGQAAADRAQTLADVQTFSDALQLEVTRAAEDYRAAQNAMEAGLLGIGAAEESYRVRREQFRAGAALAADVVDAESELRRARLELVNAAIDARIADARLARATETGRPPGIARFPPSAP